MPPARPMSIIQVLGGKLGLDFGYASFHHGLTHYNGGSDIPPAHVAALLHSSIGKVLYDQSITQG